MSLLHDSRGRASNLGPEISTLLSNRAVDGVALHFALGVDDNTSVVFEINIVAVQSPPWLALADHNTRGDLLPQLGFTLLDGGHDKVTNTSRRKTVQSPLDTTDRDNVQILGTTVISAVNHSSNGQTQSNTELGTDSTTAT